MYSKMCVVYIRLNLLCVFIHFAKNIRICAVNEYIFCVLQQYSVKKRLLLITMEFTIYIVNSVLCVAFQIETLLFGKHFKKYLLLYVCVLSCFNWDTIAVLLFGI